MQKFEGDGEGGEDGGDAPPEEWEVRRDELKSDADSHFRSGSYALAVRSYRDALELDPSNHVLLSNKSAAHLAHGEKSKALHDARRCVEIAPSWARGHTRLAAAMSSLGRHNEAAAVYARVLNELDPENEAARRGLEGCRARQQNAREEKEREASELQRELDRQKASAAGERTSREKDDAGPGNEEDDLLDDFFSEVEKVTEKPAPSTRKSDGADGKCDGDDDAKTNRIKEHINDLGTSAYQIDRLLQANYEWKNLNPFHVLDIPHTIDDDTVISLRYRALSLFVHPDKCPDDPARAKDAFEQVRKAMAQMNDADKRRHIRALVEQGMKQGKRDWDAEKSKGGANNGVVIGSGGGGVGLARAQSVATMKIFAEIEHTRRDIEKRKRGYEQRERSQEDEEKAKEKNEREHDQRWREGDRVEKRIGNWRDFTGGGDRGGGKKGRLI